MKLGLFIAIAVTAVSVAVTQQVMADEKSGHAAASTPHEHCIEGGKWAFVPGMGLANEDRLQAHIDELSVELEHARASMPRSNQQRKAMERHLAKMNNVMRDMHGTLTDDACGAMVMAAPVDQRVQVLEKRLDAMQKLLEQMVVRQTELERQ